MECEIDGTNYISEYIGQDYHTGLDRFIRQVMGESKRNYAEVSNKTSIYYD